MALLIEAAVSAYYAARIFTRTNGTIYVYYYDSGQTKMRVSTDGGSSFAAAIILTGASGIITTNDVVLRDCVEVSGKMHFVGYRASGTVEALVHTVLIDPANPGTGANWKQTDESTQGYTVVDSNTDPYSGSSTVGVDTTGNLHVGYDRGSGGSNQIWYNTRTGTTWGTPTQIEGGASYKGTSCVVVTTNDDVWIAFWTWKNSPQEVWIYRSTNGGSSWDAGTKVLQSNTSHAYGDHPVLMEEADNKLVVVGGFVDYFSWENPPTQYGNRVWNYWNGSSWTQGTTGSQTGMTLTNTTYMTNSRNCTRDGAKNVYYLIGKATTTYQVLKFAGTTWTEVTTFSSGTVARSAYGIFCQLRSPSAASVANIVYSKNNADVYFDTFTITAAAGGTSAIYAGLRDGAFFRGM